MAPDTPPSFDLHYLSEPAVQNSSRSDELPAAGLRPRSPGASASHACATAHVLEGAQQLLFYNGLWATDRLSDDEDLLGRGLKAQANRDTGVEAATVRVRRVLAGGDQLTGWVVYVELVDRVVGVATGFERDVRVHPGDACVRARAPGVGQWLEIDDQNRPFEPSAARADPFALSSTSDLWRVVLLDDLSGRHIGRHRKKWASQPGSRADNCHPGAVQYAVASLLPGIVGIGRANVG